MREVEIGADLDALYQFPKIALHIDPPQPPELKGGA